MSLFECVVQTSGDPAFGHPAPDCGGHALSLGRAVPGWGDGKADLMEKGNALVLKC
jgi:hypothetical protein